MNRRHKLHPAVVGLLLLLAGAIASAPAGADEIRVAVASNFRQAFSAVAAEFEASTGHTVVASYGSSGKQFTQIVNGAPYDLFLSADAERPERLVQEDRAIGATRFTYAHGVLALWSPEEGYV
ncbi:MAG: molybdate ABC transporter substrate-binding protein, partial [Gammaproteobacteria bacterium]